MTDRTPPAVTYERMGFWPTSSLTPLHVCPRCRGVHAFRDELEALDHLRKCQAVRGEPPRSLARERKAEAPEPTPPAEHDAAAFIRALVNAWDCCATCAGGVLARRDRERDARRAATRVVPPGEGRST